MQKTSKHPMKKMLCALFLTFISPALFAAPAAKEETITIDNTLALKKSRLSDQKNGRAVNVEYPQLHPAVPAFNREMQQFITAKRAHFKTVINPDSRYGNTLYIDYLHSMTTMNRATVLSILFESEYFTGGAHPWHELDTFNYNVKNKQFLKLNDLFKPNSDYLKLISAYCYDALKKKLEFKTEDQTQLDWLKEGTAPLEKNYRHWTLQPDGLLIHFDEYQVAAYVYGRPTVLVPYEVLNLHHPKRFNAYTKSSASFAVS